MEYTFSWGWFMIGILVAALGATILKYYVWFSENFGAGAGSYDRTKLVGLITCGVGLIFMVNLHIFLLGLLFRSLFPGL